MNRVLQQQWPQVEQEGGAVEGGRLIGVGGTYSIWAADMCVVMCGGSCGEGAQFGGGFRDLF